jgi:glycosyltransferase involved in cell wall biosynthesis
LVSQKDKSPKDLVVFGEDWGAHPSSTQHLVSFLAKNRKVLWVNSIGLRRPRLTLSDFRRLFKKLKALIHSQKASTESLQKQAVQVVQPKAIPFPGNRLARIINRRLLSSSLQPEITRKKLVNPVLWISLPTAVDVVGELNESAVVYYCGDDFGSLAGVDHGPVLQLEKELAQKADLILVASQVIAARFSAVKTHVITHGVDYELFAGLVPRAPDLPEQGLVAGFYGSLADWLDIDLICEAAKRLPDWTFLLIGSVSTDISKLRTVPNILRLGPRKHAELAAYSQHWNASLLPFLDTDQIRACNPLKLREYLAAGSPIISTDFPALDGYRDLISVVHSADELADALVNSINDGEGEREARRERVQKESWASQAQKVAELIDSL